MIVCKVKITIENEEKTVEEFQCSDTPSITPDWITLFPAESATKRKMIRNEGIASIEWEYVENKKEKSAPPSPGHRHA